MLSGPRRRSPWLQSRLVDLANPWRHSNLPVLEHQLLLVNQFLLEDLVFHADLEFQNVVVPQLVPATRRRKQSGHHQHGGLDAGTLIFSSPPGFLLLLQRRRISTLTHNGNHSSRIHPDTTTTRKRRRGKRRHCKYPSSGTRNQMDGTIFISTRRRLGPRWNFVVFQTSIVLGSISNSYFPFVRFCIH